jgi:hypothetical protein
VRDPLWRRARAVPSLDLRFADNKSLVDAVTGASLVTFTRASSGTVTDSAGVLQTAATDVPRFDHNPTTLESLGLLMEEQRTNLLLRSEEFENASWTLFGTASRTANTTVAPNGATTADSVTLPASSGIFQLVTGSASTAYTFSVWVRCDTTQTVRLVINTNLIDPTVLTVTATSSWQRFSVTKTTSVGTLTVTAQVDTGGNNTFYLWGAQLEAGAFPTSYIPTTTAAVTRSADVASIGSSAFSGFYNQNEGTVFAQYDQVAGGGGRICEFSDGSTSSIPFFVSGSVKASMNIFVSGVNSGRIDSGTAPSPGVFVSAIASFAPADRALCTDGGLMTTSTSPATLPVLNAVQIGADTVGGSRRNGRIRRLTYWPRRLPDSTLQAVTQ